MLNAVVQCLYRKKDQTPARHDAPTEASAPASLQPALDGFTRHTQPVLPRPPLVVGFVSPGGFGTASARAALRSPAQAPSLAEETLFGERLEQLRLKRRTGGMQLSAFASLVRQAEGMLRSFPQPHWQRQIIDVALFSLLRGRDEVMGSANAGEQTAQLAMHFCRAHGPVAWPLAAEMAALLPADPRNVPRTRLPRPETWLQAKRIVRQRVRQKVLAAQDFKLTAAHSTRDVLVGGRLQMFEEAAPMARLASMGAVDGLLRDWCNACLVDLLQVSRRRRTDETSAEQLHTDLQAYEKRLLRLFPTAHDLIRKHIDYARCQWVGLPPTEQWWSTFEVAASVVP